MLYFLLMLFSLFAIISGFLGLAYEVIYQRAFSLINGDLYSTYAIIVLTFIVGMSLGNLSGFKLRRHLPLLEAFGGIFAVFFGLFLHFGGYTLEFPLPLLIFVLALPAFIVGIHVPLYSYYLRRFSFSLVYFFYHLGAVIGVFGLELLIFPRLPLSWIFIVLGAIQIIIGAIIFWFYRQKTFVINQNNFTYAKILTLVKNQRKYLGAIFLISLLSFYYHFSMLRVLLFYQYLIRPAYSYFIAASVFYVTVGSFIALKTKFSLRTVAAFFAIHCLAVILLLIPAAQFLVGFDFTNIHFYLIILDLIAFSPLLWATVFLCRALSLSRPPRNLIDVYSGLGLAVSSCGNIFGYLLVALLAGAISSWWWIIPLVLLALIVIVIHYQDHFSIFAVAAILLALYVFAFQYDFSTLLSEGLGTKKYLYHRQRFSPSLLRTMPHFADYQTYSRHYHYRLANVAADYNSLVAVFDYRIPTVPDLRQVYTVDGYVSHLLNTYDEMAVGIIPRIYFSQPLSRSLVIGIGTGQTTAGTTMVSEHTTAVDINPAVFAFLPQLSQQNNHLLDNPSATLVRDDGMNYLKNTDQKFQLILNTATNMFTHGVAKLHTDEFLQLVKTRLAPEGVYLSWLDSDGIDSNQELRRVISLQKKHFSFVDAHFISSQYVLLVAYDQPRPLQNFSTELLSPADQQYLRDRGITLPDIPRVRNLGANFTPATLTPAPKMDFPLIEIDAIDNYLHPQRDSAFLLRDAIDNLFAI